MLIHAIIPASRANGPDLRAVVVLSRVHSRMPGMLESDEPSVPRARNDGLCLEP